MDVGVGGDLGQLARRSVKGRSAPGDAEAQPYESSDLKGAIGLVVGLVLDAKLDLAGLLGTVVSFAMLAVTIRTAFGELESTSS